MPANKPMRSLYDTSDTELLDEVARNDIEVIVIVDPVGVPLKLCSRLTRAKGSFIAAASG